MSSIDPQTERRVHLLGTVQVPQVTAEHPGHPAYPRAAAWSPSASAAQITSGLRAHQPVRFFTIACEAGPHLEVSEGVTAPAAEASLGSEPT